MIPSVLLFDIRTDQSHAGYISVVNQGLDREPGNVYRTQFGHVGSPRWWACFDRGELPVKAHAGIVTFVGLRAGWGSEEEDVIEFSSNGRLVAYDRTDHWAVNPIGIGDRVCITRTQATLSFPTGAEQYLIDVRAEWWPAATTEEFEQPR